MSYQDRFTWLWRLGENCLAHKDGAVSLMFRWQGIQSAMQTQENINSAYQNYRLFLRCFDTGYVVENHFWRSFDPNKVDGYRKRTDAMERGHQFGRFVRDEMANFMASYSMTNEVAYVVTLLPSARFKFLTATKKLKKQRVWAEQLIHKVRSTLTYLNNSELLSNDEYLQKITQSARPDVYALNRELQYSDRFLLNHQLINTKPELDGDLIKVGQSYFLPILLAFYPEQCPAGWFDRLADQPNVEMHVSQIIEPLDTRGAIRASHNEERKSISRSETSSADYMDGKAGDHAAFKQFVADHDLEVFRNTYILTLTSQNKEYLLEESENVIKQLQKETQVRYGKHFNFLHYRVALPGQGYQAKFKRPDHEILISNMAPIITYDCGVENPSEIRLSSTLEVVGFDTPEGKPYHGLTAAKTNSGKSLDKVVTIAETFPLGRDWYIAEVGGEHGGSYQWVVEAYGGTYTRIDPDKTVINPFPPYEDAKMDADLEAGEWPLDTHLTKPTLHTIAFILVGETRDLTVFELEVAEFAMQSMYVVPEDKYAPNFADFLQSMKELKSAYEGKQAAVLISMIEHVDSFLKGPHGRIFKQDDNLIISDGITGVDFRPLVTSGNTELLKFYITFVGMRYAQKAYASMRLSTIMFDEIQECTRYAPKETTNLVDQIVRMGRKDAGSFDGISQDINALKIGATISQVSRVSLLYMESGKEEAVACFPSLPQPAIETFNSFQSPADWGFREAIRLFESKAYHLRLMFPQALIDLGDTFSPRVCALKKQIAEITQDPLERLKLFDQKRYQDA